MARRRRGAAWRMALLVVLLLLAGSFVNVGGAKKKSKASSSIATLFPRYLRSMKESESGSVKLDDEGWKELIVGPDDRRPFHVLAMFTAAASGYGCISCMQNAQVVNDVARYYSQQRSPSATDQPMIFAVVDIDYAPQAFKAMKLTTVPHAFIFKANTSVVLPPPMEHDLFRVAQGSEQGFLNSVREWTGVTVKPMPNRHFTVSVAVILATLLALVAYLAIDHMDWIKKVPRSRNLWFLVSLTVYGAGVGGMVYCIIRRSPSYTFDQQHRVVLFALHTSQDQFVLEGVVVASLNILTALSFAMTVVLASTKRNRVVRFIGVNLALALSIYFLQRLMKLHETKTRWYNIHDTFHAPVSDFMFGAIKKSSSLLRRLIRLSQLWLWEYKDWAAFHKHVNGYLIKYAKREYGHVLQRLGIAAASKVAQ